MLTILNRYIAKKYFFILLSVIIVISGLILLFDLVEQIRVYSGKGIPFADVVLLSFYRMFYLIQKTNAYAVLLAGILTYQVLTKNSELVIIRASGIPITRFLLPSIIVVIAFGIIMTTIINPLSSRMIYEYERLEAHYKKGSASALSLTKTGLWIKDNISEHEERVIHALRLSENDQELYDVSFYVLDHTGAFLKRFDAEKAKLKGSIWIASNVQVFDNINNQSHYDSLTFPTSISFNQINESMLTPEIISFWRLPDFISIAEDSGLSATKHKIYFYKLLIQPLYFAAMLILGVAFALTIPRHGKVGKYLVYGLTIGFILNFFEYFAMALGTSGRVPVFLAAIAPTIVTLMLGLYLQLNQEEI